MRVTYRLHEPQQARKAFAAAWEHAKAMTMAGHRLTLTVAPERRSDVDNSHYHFLIGEISKQANTLDLSVFDVNNDPSFVLVLRQRLRDREDAKRLLISGFRNQTEHDDQYGLVDEWRKFGQPQMSPGLYGEMVVFGAQSRRFTTRLAKAFIAYLYEFADDTGAVIPPSDYERELLESAS